jgi:hypothetical protein
MPSPTRAHLQPLHPQRVRGSLLRAPFGAALPSGSQLPALRLVPQIRTARAAAVTAGRTASSPEAREASGERHTNSTHAMRATPSKRARPDEEPAAAAVGSIEKARRTPSRAHLLVCAGVGGLAGGWVGGQAV